MGDDYQGRVLVYSLTGCAHCKAAKHTLTTLNVPFTDVSIDQYDSSVRQEVKERTGKSTVPQIFFNDVYIGGNVELQEVVSMNLISNSSIISVGKCNVMWLNLQFNAPC